ncbi:hypothetical protein B0H19DRAFT_548504 [Mycena capillaripes]|nr:hypothetical protein B0H19DRAFT_548504 [Mycena capillaripes]
MSTTASYSPGAEPGEIQRADHVHQVSNAALLRTVIDETSRLLILEFAADLQFSNESVWLQLLQHPNQPIDILDMGPQVFTSDDYKASIRFVYLLTQKPYTEAYTSVLSCLQLDSITVNGVKEPIPHIPRAVWDKVLSENPWAASYIDSAGDIFRSCSNLIYGKAIPAIWTLKDLDVALHTSNFSSVTQVGLRSYMEEHPSTERFLSRCV